MTKSKKVLIVSNMYPSKEKSYAGIFVKNQLEFMTAAFPDWHFDKFVLKRSFTNSVGSVIKYIAFFASFFKKLFIRYDVIHLHYFVPLIFPLSLYKFLHPKVKFICTFHGRDITVQADNKFLKPLYRYLSRKLDVGVAVGEEIKVQVSAKLKVPRVIVLSAGVDDRVFFKEDDGKEFDFIFVGSLIFRKGVDRLIAAIRDLPRNVRFCLIGSGEYADDVRSLINDGYKVSLYQGLTQIQIKEKLNQARYFVFPSRNEGYPLSTIEAMFCGLPVIGSNIPQVAEQIQNGQNGWIVNMEAPGSLNAALERALITGDEKYSAMVSSALASHRKESLSAVCGRLIEIYNETNKKLGI